MLEIEIECIVSLLKMNSNKYYFGNYEKITGWKKDFFEFVYLIHKYPSSLTRDRMALLSGFHTRKVQMWIQNRRTKKDAPIQNPRKYELLRSIYKRLTPDERRYGDISYEILIDIFFIVTNSKY